MCIRDRIYIPDAIPDKHKRISELIQRKYNLKIKKYTSGRKIAKDYGQEIFEGMKAYRTPDGSIQFFRPEENFKRMYISAERLVIPQLNVDDCLQALHELVKIDADWVPHTDGASLYIRPFIFAADPFLGVRPGDKYYFMIIMSPSGAYYASGLDPVNIYVETNYVRAVRGGMGLSLIHI